ncbi:MAG: class I SAM-dependent methyltransferase [Syntrophothermus sp.]|uniref:class I SAM-dependent methyltransferase n=1 Tax=Syntrophothermus sp. TaxID=2736299 RepID=UPI00257C78C8|nr:class I SAM-dependent methyltransferase [Syntrophothermus sp.]NSW82500.1 class I SAM-dependent methyltransferase [Syntrophothermus sp.]
MKQKDYLRFAVTTSLRPSPEQVAAAKRLAAELNTVFLERNNLSLKSLSRLFNVERLIVVSAQKVSCISPEGKEFFFHPSLAILRIKEIKDGKTDQMINAMSLGTGHSVLDCTLGLGTDAIVASYVTGSGGRVTGLESSPVISALVRAGLSSYNKAGEDIAAAMRRITVITTDYKEYLATLPPCCYDVVYFDPMFRLPGRKSPPVDAFRTLANHAPVDRESVELALRAAVKRVVLKERRGSLEFERLGFKKIYGGKYSPVAYGVIDLQG